MGLSVFAMLFAVSLGACDASEAKTASNDADTTRAAVQSRPPLSPEDAARYRALATAAWKYFQAEYQPATGLVNAAPAFASTTLWDIGAQILAFVAARDVGLIDAPTFESRIGKTLSTLETTRLYENIGFNRFYSTKDGSPDAQAGRGVSSTDLGRFFVALHVLATRYPQFAERARGIAARNDLRQLVKDGYLQGHAVKSDGTRWSFQEGRIGYEQYVAKGFSFWGGSVAPALSLGKNAKPVSVLGIPLVADKRGNDRLLSEPFILYGLELGMPSDVSDLARRVLQAQEARFKQTGVVTIASEDAIAVKPYYFYYYCVYCNAKPYIVGVATPAIVLDEPRWVSTKAAFGWEALFPSDYTKRALQYVSVASDESKGWATGVYEKTGASSNTFDINTSAVLLEVAAFQLRGSIPLIARSASNP